MLPSKWLHIYSAADAAWKLFGKGAPVSWQTSDPGIEDDLPKISATPFLFTARPKKWSCRFSDESAANRLIFHHFSTSVRVFFQRLSNFLTLWRDLPDLSRLIKPNFWTRCVSVHPSFETNQTVRIFLTVHSLLHPLWLTTWFRKHWN